MKRNPNIIGPNGYTPEKPMFITAVCERNGCADPALRVPALKIPVKGLGSLVEPFEVQIGKELCVAHLQSLNPQDYLTQLVRGAAKTLMKGAGVEPDFDKAFFGSIHIMSEDYRRQQMAQHGDLSAARAAATNGEMLLTDRKVRR